MTLLGRIDLAIYRFVSPDIVTDTVILTDERLAHIRQRHPNDYERYSAYLTATFEQPDYIIETNAPKTAFVLKEFFEDEIHFRLILRLQTATDQPGRQNSIITFQHVNAKEYARLLRNKKILYKRPDL